MGEIYQTVQVWLETPISPTLEICGSIFGFRTLNQSDLVNSVSGEAVKANRHVLTTVADVAVNLECYDSS